MSARRLFRRHCIRIGGLLGVWGLFFRTGLPCPLLWATGLPCPTCGVTRALLALAQGDPIRSLYCHPLAMPLTVSVVLAAHLRLLRPVLRRFAALFVGVTLAANTCFFLFRLLTFL